MNKFFNFLISFLVISALQFPNLGFSETMPELKEGDKAPDFTLPSSDGGNVSLKDFKGKENIVLYFYPKDCTSGCTQEGQVPCAFEPLR